MSKYNPSEFSQSKSRKFKWSVWFPYPSSWLNALALSAMLSAILSIVKITGITGLAVAVFLDSPEIFVIFGIIALLSPIATIAFAHHLLHVLLNKLSPTIQAPEIGNPQGIIPGLISWWEGLYGWLAMVISMLISIGIGIIIVLLFDLRYEKLAYYYRQNEFHIGSILAITFIIIAAFMYQIEHFFKQRLISTKTRQGKSNQMQPNPDSLAREAEINKIKTELGLNQASKNQQ